MSHGSKFQPIIQLGLRKRPHSAGELKLEGSMSKHTLIITITLLLFAPWAYSQPPAEHNYKPPQGYVPDAATAIKIAVAVWEPIYGQEQIAQQKPYKAVLVKGVWKVECWRRLKTDHLERLVPIEY